MRHDPGLPPGLRLMSEADDLAAVERLLARCSDYFLLQDGELPTVEDAENLFREVPPGRQAADLLAFGHEKDAGIPGDDLAAVVVLLPDYPEPGIWYLPFMAVDPAMRGRELGRTLHRRLMNWAAVRGATGFQLVVLDDNGGGRQFWTRLGYRPLRRVGPDRFKSREHFRIEMRCAVAG